MLEKLVRRLVAYFSDSRFLLRNMHIASRISLITERRVGSVVITGLDSECYRNAVLLFEAFNSSGHMGWSKRILYRIYGNRLVLVARDAEGVILGAAFYYFNQRDIEDRTVHAAFSVVEPAVRGKGLVTEIRRHGIRHFKMNGFSGVSSRVSEENRASLAANIKLGFVSRDVYKDPVTGAVRHYLVCEFDRQVSETDE